MISHHQPYWAETVTPPRSLLTDRVTPLRVAVTVPCMSPLLSTKCKMHGDAGYAFETHGTRDLPPAESTTLPRINACRRTVDTLHHIVYMPSSRTKQTAISRCKGHARYKLHVILLRPPWLTLSAPNETHFSAARSKEHNSRTKVGVAVQL